MQLQREAALVHSSFPQHPKILGLFPSDSEAPSVLSSRLAVLRTNHRRTPPAPHEAPEEPRGGRAAPTATAAPQEMVPGRNTITLRLHSPRHSALQRPARNTELENTAANEILGIRHRRGAAVRTGPDRGQHRTSRWPPRSAGGHVNPALPRSRPTSSHQPPSPSSC